MAGHSHYAKKVGLDDKVPDLFLQVAMNYHDGICTCAGADVLHARLSDPLGGSGSAWSHLLPPPLTW